MNLKNVNKTQENFHSGDTLFYRDFSLGRFIEEFKKLQPGASLIVHCSCPG
jgi:hypothetical protein